MATEQHPTYSISMQSAVYSTAFFNGTVQSMASTIVALLVVALIDKNLALLIGVILASRQFLTVTMSVYSGTLMDNFGTKRVIIAFGVAGVLSALAYPAISMVLGVEVGASLQNPGIALILAVIFVQMISGWSEATAWIGSQTLVGQLMKGPSGLCRAHDLCRPPRWFPRPASHWLCLGFLGAVGRLWLPRRCGSVGGMIAASFLPDTRAATQGLAR